MLVRGRLQVEPAAQASAVMVAVAVPPVTVARTCQPSPLPVASTMVRPGVAAR
jgi:hypothetical protein